MNDYFQITIDLSELEEVQARREEIVRALRTVSSDIEKGGTPNFIYNKQGNRIGRVSYRRQIL